MALFVTLPAELSLQIFRYLGLKEFLALSSTHTFLRRITQPLMYREFHWVWETDRQREPPIYLLSRTLAERPDLGAHIEHLTLEGQTQKTILSTGKDALEFQQADLSPLKKLVDELQVSPSEIWKQLLDDGALDAFVALLLSRLPNLRSLGLGFDFQFKTPCTTAVLRNGLLLLRTEGARSQVTFKKLREVSLCQDKIDANKKYLPPRLPENSLGSNPSFKNEIEHLLFSDPITTLTLWLQDEPDLYWPERVPSSSNLTTLILHHSEVREHTLGLLLSQLQSLQVLEYHYKGNTDRKPTRNRSSYLNCAILSEALDQVKETLRRLEISARWYSNQGANVEEQCNWGVMEHLKSFREYPHLQTLIVPLVILLGWSPATSKVKLAEALPASLERFCLTDDLILFSGWEWMQVDYLARFHDYVHDWREHAPSLKHVSMRINGDSSYRWAPDMDREWIGIYWPPQHIMHLSENQNSLKKTCENVGIGFNVERKGIVWPA
ncbi:hypothetical protein MMC11_002751 [Xylographa trunciseda]|nr:hypothetical protein [Xylographa trunciseda]